MDKELNVEVISRMKRSLEDLNNFEDKVFNALQLLSESKFFEINKSKIKILKENTYSLENIVNILKEELEEELEEVTK